MGASRESKNLFFDLRNKKWKLAFGKIKLLFMVPQHSTMAHKIYATEQRRLIIKDSFKTPFNKSIGCRLFGHKWSSDEDDKKYEFNGMHYCWKCSKWESKEELRNNKIKSVLK